MIFPENNRKDWDELTTNNPNITKGLTVYFVRWYKDVYEIAFNYGKKSAQEEADEENAEEDVDDDVDDEEAQ